MDKKPVKRVTSQKVVFISFAVDILDVLLNTVVAILSGSVVMLTQAMEGVSDLAASGLLFFGLKRSQKDPDKSHPFGYGRELYFWTLISVLITVGITATMSIVLGWNRFLHPQPVHDIQLAFIVLAITVVTNGYALFLSIQRLLRSRSFIQIIRIFTHSSLIETKMTLVLDLMGTVASILGIGALGIYTITGDLRYDGLGSIAIGLVLVCLSYVLIKAVKDLLVGKTASAEVEAKIRLHSLSIPQVKRVLGIKTMHIGSERLLVNLDVQLDSSLTTKEIEKLIDQIKDKIRSEIPSVKHIQVELETP